MNREKWSKGLDLIYLISLSSVVLILILSLLLMSRNGFLEYSSLSVYDYLSFEDELKKQLIQMNLGYFVSLLGFLILLSLPIFRVFYMAQVYIFNKEFVLSLISLIVLVLCLFKVLF